MIIGLVIAFGVVKLADTFNHAGMAAAAAAHHTTVNEILGAPLAAVLVVTVIAFAVMSVMAARRRRPARHDRDDLPRRRSHAGAGDDRGHEGPEV